MSDIAAMLSESLKSSLNLRLMSYYLLAFVLFFIAFGIVFSALGIVAMTVYWVFGIQEISIAIFAIIVLVGIILLYYANAVLHGLFLLLARDFIGTGKLSFSEALNNALQRANTLFAANVLISVFFLIIFIILMMPAVLPLLGALQQLSPLALFEPQALVSLFLPVVLTALAMIAVFFIFLFLISPFTFLVAPVIVFESLSVFGGIRKAFNVTRQNYLQNLLAVLVFIVVVVIISFFSSAMQFVLNLLVSFVPLLGLLFLLVLFAFELFVVLFSTAFQSVFLLNYYKANCGAFVPAPKPKKKEKPKAEEPIMPSESETKTVKLEPWMGKRI